VPVFGGARSGPNYSGRVIWATRNCRPRKYITKSGPRPSAQQNDDLPAGYGQIIKNANVVVGYIGQGKYTVDKNGGATGTYDADAVSTGTITGDIEIIAEYRNGVFFAGINNSNPTLSSGLGFTSLVMTGLDVQLYDRFTTLIGGAGAHHPYGRLVYTAADDTARVYASDDGISWGAAVASVVVGLGTTTFYFDSTLRDIPSAFNMLFRPLPATVAYSMVADVATFTFSPQAVNLLRGYSLVASATTFSFSPQAVNLLRGYDMIASNATFAFSPQTVGLVAAYFMTATAASFSFNPQSVNLGLGKTLTADTMSISFSPQAVNLLRGYDLSAALAVFSFNPQDIATHLHATLVANAASYSFSPQDSRLNLNLFTMPPSSGGGSGVKVVAVLL